MKKHLLLLLIVIAGACIDSSGTGPKQNCNVQYSSNGVVISQLKPDYSKTYVGGNIRYNIEVTNVGEKRAENIQINCTDPADISCPETAIFNGAPFTLNPPDTTACIEGEVKQDQAIVTAKNPTGEEPAYFRLMLSYNYSSLSWAEVTLVSEAQWKVRTQQGIKPVQSAYQSASPVKIELGVPDAPVVYEPGGANEFPVSIVLKNTVEGYANTRTSTGEDDKVDSVVITVPDSSPLVFVSTNCNELASGTLHESTKCTVGPVSITPPDEEVPNSVVVKARITSQIADEDTYKITAESKYTYIVKYASPQGVEIGKGGESAGGLLCGT